MSPTLVVTAAGRARRLEPVSSVIPKPFLPVAVDIDGALECPLVRLVHQFRAVGVRRVLVAGTDHPWFTTLRLDGVSLGVVVVPPDGEWSAVEACHAAAAGAAPLFVASGDNVFADSDIAEFALTSLRDHQACRVAVSLRTSTSGFTRVEVVGERVRRLEEKPSDGPGGLAKAGLYSFAGSALSEALELPPRRDRFGERSMTEVLLGLIDVGAAVVTHRLRYPFQDIGTVSGLRDAVFAGPGVSAGDPS